MVGGTIWWWTASAVMPASRPPAAPSRWPVIDLVDDIASFVAWSPKQRLMAMRLDLVAVRRRGAVRVDVVDLRAASMPALSSAAPHHADRAVAVLGRRGDVVRVGGHAVADDLGVDPRAARAAPSSSSSRISTPAPSPMTKPSRSLSNGRLARSGSSLRVDSARIAPNPPTPIGVIAASEPPAIIASASPRRMISNASPMACADAEQAVQVAEFGPLAPNRIDTWPAARLMIADGMKNGEILRGPPSSSALCSRSMVVNPPMPERDEHADARRHLRRDRQPASSIANCDAAIANWMKMSIFLTSFFSMNCSGSKPLTSPAMPRRELRRVELA